MSKKRALFILDKESYNLAYGTSQREAVARLVDVYAPQQTKESIRDDPAVLADMQVMFSGWGVPQLDAAFLQCAPQLQAIFHAAGTVRTFMTDEAWDRNMVVSSAYAVNAIPVAEFTFSQILFCLKLGWQHYHHMKQLRQYGRLPDKPGAYGSTVGIISLGQIGQHVCKMLLNTDINIISYNPSPKPELVERYNLEMVGLDDLFRRSDVVSLHAPLLAETEGMITGRHFELMKYRASFINTARGGVVNEPEMIEVLKRRDDLVAVLDVTRQEPLEPESPLWDMPNVALFPHIAGSWDHECLRLGQCVVDELRRYLSGEPLEWKITRQRAARLA